MAEFVEVARQWNRMCREHEKCEGCPIRDANCACHSLPFGAAFAWETESRVMAWAAAHPEPKYPTWMEWLEDMWKQHGAGYEDYADFLHSAPIPADIAGKLGIEPKEDEC